MGKKDDEVALLLVPEEGLQRRVTECGNSLSRDVN